jgi:MFS family permease
VADERWLTKGVAGIGGASLLSDAGHEVVTALLPSLLTTGLGAPAAALGLVEGVSDALAGAARLAGGALADDPRRRRRVAVGGYAATAVVGALISGAQSVWQVGVLRTGAWVARGLRVPARNALLADVVPRNAYGRAYGFERAMDNVGAIVGPLLALALVATVGVRGAIALSVIPGLLAAAAIAYAIRHAPKVGPRAAATAIRLHWRPVLRGDLGRLLAAVAAFEVGNVAATLLILRATEVLTPGRGPDAATVIALALYTAYNAAAAGASLLAGRAADRFGPQWAIAAGVALFLAGYLGFAAGTGLAVLAAAFLAAGVAIGCVETAQHAAVAALAPVDLRGSSFGVLAAVQAGGNLAASAVAGVLWTAVSASAAFVYLAGWMVVALVATLTTVRPGTRSGPNPAQ